MFYLLAQLGQGVELGWWLGLLFWGALRLGLRLLGLGRNWLRVVAHQPCVVYYGLR